MATRLSNLALRSLRSSRRLYSSEAGDAGHHSDQAWKRAFFIAGLPALGLVWYNAYYIMPQHPERDEFVQYPHLRIRNRPFPWGDGQKSIFHNPYYNALPDGYEEGSEELHGGHH